MEGHARRGMEGAQREDRAKRGRAKGGKRREGGTEGDYPPTPRETTTTSAPLEIQADARIDSRKRDEGCFHLRDHFRTPSDPSRCTNRQQKARRRLLPPARCRSIATLPYSLHVVPSRPCRAASDLQSQPTGAFHRDLAVPPPICKASQTGAVPV